MDGADQVSNWLIYSKSPAKYHSWRVKLDNFSVPLSPRDLALFRFSLKWDEKCANRTSASPFIGEQSIHARFIHGEEEKGEGNGLFGMVWVRMWVQGDDLAYIVGLFSQSEIVCV